MCIRSLLWQTSIAMFLTLFCPTPSKVSPGGSVTFVLYIYPWVSLFHYDCMCVVWMMFES
ncbi:hypothetical protein M758_1G274500 [Ceratodon purpureus]|uniref:Uncharacterized protein n=1 Tax=Ceratodon purpureus TaxID=3225 RepID=A0A8T0JAP1_CERPU|nr:hypothetical protein KC19_1G282500 [Ceratodon purpureus]KAG0631715.1 hypothetical protein M758_1G274500 [Ceratodon purpureus]